MRETDGRSEGGMLERSRSTSAKKISSNIHTNTETERASVILSLAPSCSSSLASACLPQRRSRACDSRLLIPLTSPLLLPSPSSFAYYSVAVATDATASNTPDVLPSTSLLTATLLSLSLLTCTHTQTRTLSLLLARSTLLTRTRDPQEEGKRGGEKKGFAPFAQRNDSFIDLQ